MKVLICGDVVGKSGRMALNKNIPEILQKEKIDFVIVNGENAAGGFGITKKICEEFYELGVDAITTGNHVWDQREIIQHIEKDKRLIRPCNFPSKTPGRGYGVYQLKDGNKIVVVNVMCRLFMESLENPFTNLENVINEVNLLSNNHFIIVDVHGESTSEKMAIGQFFDGNVTAVFGTHTHIPTADLHILEKGTLYQSDLGMCGDYDSVIGMKKELCINRFRKKFLKTKLEPASGEGTLCGTIFTINEKNRVIEYNQVIMGGRLQKR